MYNRPNPWQSYRQVAAQTASPGQLVLMLYDGSIRLLEKALEGFSETDPLLFNQTINNNILKAQAIIHELSYSLNMDLGGEFDQRLHALYDYLDRRLQESNISKTQHGILEALKHLTVIRDAWSEMLSNGAGRAPSTIIPATPHLQTQSLEAAQFAAA